MTITASPSGVFGPVEPALPDLPTPPEGWPVGSYATYAEAQRAVNHLTDEGFPVEDLTIVGVDLMLVERVLGPLSWVRVLASGAWFGLLVGALFAAFSPPGTDPFGPVLVGVLSGLVFGAVFAAARHARSERRAFTSASQLVANRYDVLCRPRHAEKARDLLARLELRGPAA